MKREDRMRLRSLRRRLDRFAGSSREIADLYSHYFGLDDVHADITDEPIEYALAKLEDLAARKALG